ncbi:MAG TPA: ribonuclease H-like domain-containing protein [Verrucomicrobiales bacterium]|nr:ribonuclease H-like domain-containing protein [Verrucomicrobiales bacterium]
MPRDFLYFDLETQRSAGDVGGWHRKSEMRMSIGVTFSTRLGTYQIYTEDTVDRLVDQLRAADLVIGYNHINFDYQVLMRYTILDLPAQIPSLDLCVELERSAGHRPKLDDVAMATLQTGKTAEGLQAIQWWREGRLIDLARYCCHDVKVTRLVHEYGVHHSAVKFYDGNRRVRSTPVKWDAP